MSDDRIASYEKGGGKEGTEYYMDKIHVLVSDITLLCTHGWHATACLEYGHLGISIYMQISSASARGVTDSIASDGVA